MRQAWEHLLRILDPNSDLSSRRSSPNSKDGQEYFISPGLLPGWQGDTWTQPMTASRAHYIEVYVVSALVRSQKPQREI